MEPDPEYTDPVDEQAAALDRYYERAIRISWTVAAIGAIVAAIAWIGEGLDWWDDLGVTLATLGSLVAFAGGLYGLFSAATRHQTTVLDTRARTTNVNLFGVVRTLSRMDRKLDKLDDLDVITAHLNQQTGILVQIRDRL